MGWFLASCDLGWIFLLGLGRRFTMLILGAMGDPFANGMTHITSEPHTLWADTTARVLFGLYLLGSIVQLHAGLCALLSPPRTTPETEESSSGFDDHVATSADAPTPGPGDGVSHEPGQFTDANDATLSSHQPFPTTIACCQCGLQCDVWVTKSNDNGNKGRHYYKCRCKTFRFIDATDSFPSVGPSRSNLAQGI